MIYIYIYMGGNGDQVTSNGGVQANRFFAIATILSRYSHLGLKSNNVTPAVETWHHEYALCGAI
jgi:hypothetical protein